MRLDATLAGAYEEEMEVAKKNAKDKQMAVAFLLGGSEYFDSLRINLASTFMMGKEYHYPKSNDTGQTHQNHTFFQQQPT